MYLVDTNVWLEVFLNRANTTAAKEFLNQKEPLFVSSLTVDTLGIMLEKAGKLESFKIFMTDVLFGGIGFVHLSAREIAVLPELMKKLRVDYEDAYQLASAAKVEARLVTQDKKLLKLAGVVALGRA